ncbi:hypothetical protein B0T24DRAFT_113105 [Lasiosphaeria ovina]|uniref:Uncharacterized protein n=1 Tax=Lasiosphaeria ovina TaxID=92902 RepID=A0AAE0JTX3_9PEZI|nr:hypothetical protein B0T24DRAFT_113105 [Lasiosphaeria ovina]
MQLSKLLVVVLHASASAAIWCGYTVPGGGAANGVCQRECKGGSSSLNCADSYMSRFAVPGDERLQVHLPLLRISRRTVIGRDVAILG